MNDTVRSLRYPVGSKTPFLLVMFTSATPRFGRLYFPWEDTLDDIRIELLESIEHHPVADAHEPDGLKEYDGFVLRSMRDGELWQNQYPTASYGQVTNHCDYIAEPADWKKYTEHNFTYYLTDAREYLRNLARGVHSLRYEEKMINPRHADLLQAHLEDVVRRIEAQCKLKTVQTQIMLSKPDENGNERPLPGWLKFTFEEIQ